MTRYSIDDEITIKVKGHDMPLKADIVCLKSPFNPDKDNPKYRSNYGIANNGVVVSFESKLLPDKNLFRGQILYKDRNTDEFFIRVGDHEATIDKARLEKLPVRV